MTSYTPNDVIEPIYSGYVSFSRTERECNVRFPSSRWRFRISSLERMIRIDRGRAYFICHGPKEIFNCFGGNRTRLVGGRSPSLLAGPGGLMIYVVNK